MNKRRHGIHDVGFFVTCSIRWSPDPIGRIKSLIETAIKEFMEELTDQPRKDNGIEAYPTLKYSTFNLFYSPMFKYLVEKWEKDICDRDVAKSLIAKVRIFSVS